MATSYGAPATSDFSPMKLWFGGCYNKTITTASMTTSSPYLLDSEVHYKRIWRFTVNDNGSQDGCIKLPDATKFSTTGGPIYYMTQETESGRELWIKDNGGTTVGRVKDTGEANEKQLLVVLLDNSTSAGSWACFHTTEAGLVKSATS